MTGGTLNRNLTVKFLEATNYTLTANFTLPDGMPYTKAQTVSVIPETPIVTASGVLLSDLELQWITSVDLTGQAVYWVQPGTGVNLGVIDNHDPAATYEWNNQYIDPTASTDPYLYFGMPLLYANGSMIYPVKCRALRNGRYSEWATLWLYSSDSPPSPPQWITGDSANDEDEASEE